jgi:excisionase family DNA binding protein
MTNGPTAASEEMDSVPVRRDYTVSDLSGRLQCSERHIWLLIDQGLVPGVMRLGRLVRLHGPTVDAWLAAGAPQRRARP